MSENNGTRTKRKVAKRWTGKKSSTSRLKYIDKEGRQRKTLANTVRSMNAILGGTGTSEQTRDFNEECGYPDELDLDLHIGPLYDREGVAQRVVHVYPVETWKTSPEVYQVLRNEETTFEKEVDRFVRRFNLWSVLERADKLSGIGQYGVVLFGIDDGKELDQPVSRTITDWDGAEIVPPRKARKVTFIRTFEERQMRILEVEEDPSSPRFGRPIYYAIKMKSPAEGSTTMTSSYKETKVHWTRCIHLADNRTSSETIGVPRLSPAYNRINDLRKVLGGSAEMFWKGGFPGLSFEVQPGLGDLEFDEDEFKTAIDNYAKGLQRYLRVVGIKVNSLAPQVADPTPQIDASLDQICITINCPKRIFLGTESAHLASTQDQKSWSDRVNGRRERYAIPYIIVPVMRYLMMLGELPILSQDEFYVDWKDAEEVDPLVRAQALEKLVNAMAQYTSSGLATLIPPLRFLTDFVNLPLDLAKLIIEEAKSEEGKPTLKLKQAMDDYMLQQQQAEQKKEATMGTAPPGESGRKPGSGAKREVDDVSTGQNG